MRCCNLQIIIYEYCWLYIVRASKFWRFYYASLASEDSSLFLKDKLNQLGKRRKEIETGIQALEEMIEEIERESVTQEFVILALYKFTDVFEHIQPYRQKELLNLVLHKAILAQDSIKIALFGRPPRNRAIFFRWIWDTLSDTNLAPVVGFEPTTYSLTGSHSTIELHRNAVLIYQKL